MTVASQLAARLRQSVQGCTLHIHGPVQSWLAIEQACAQGQTTHQEVAQIAIESCTHRIEELTREGVAPGDQRIVKELKTRAFIERLLLGWSGTIDKLTPRLSVDVVIRHPTDPREIVLVARKNPPHGWALPGGCVDIGETVEHAVRREARAETGLDLEELTLIGVYSDPLRDRRGHIVSIAFSAVGRGALAAGSDAGDARYFPLERLPELLFDHAMIVRDYASKESCG